MSIPGTRYHCGTAIKAVIYMMKHSDELPQIMRYQFEEQGRIILDFIRDIEAYADKQQKLRLQRNERRRTKRKIERRSPIQPLSPGSPRRPGTPLPAPPVLGRRAEPRAPTPTITRDESPGAPLSSAPLLDDSRSVQTLSIHYGESPVKKEMTPESLAPAASLFGTLPMPDYWADTCSHISFPDSPWE